MSAFVNALQRSACVNRTVLPLPPALLEAAGTLFRQSGLTPRQQRTDAQKLKQFLFTRHDKQSTHASTMTFRKREGLAYLYSRLSASYGATYFALDELRRRWPEFEPTNVLDYGSGIASTAWAVGDLWPNVNFNYTGVELSQDMINLSLDLLEMTTDTRPWKASLRFQEHFPMGMTGHELVVGAHVLSEIPDSRDNLVDLLWAQTTHALVLVELGNDAGFATIMQARDRLLKHHKDAVVLAPCPHAHQCPLAGTPTPCHTPMRIDVPPSQHLSAFTLRQGHVSEKLTYLVVARPAAMDKFAGPENVAATWPRIVGNPLQRRHHIVFSACTSKGTEEKLVVRHADRLAWRDAKRREWGEQLPPVAAFKEAQQHLDTCAISNSVHADDDDDDDDDGGD